MSRAVLAGASRALRSQRRENCFVLPCATKPKPRRMKPFSTVEENGRKPSRTKLSPYGQRRGFIMSALINLIYREYCLTCLGQMRKQA